MTNAGSSSAPPAPPRSGLRRQWRLFLLAGSFLTRLIPARQATFRELSDACLYFPLVGLLLGGVLTLPFFLGVFASQPGVQAALYVALSAWLTRALHLDGFADVLDALGSGTSGQKFHAVLKDSRIGVFGCAGLTCALVLQAALLAACLEAQRFLPLLYAPLCGRCLPLLLASLSFPADRSGLGMLVANAPQARCVQMLLFAGATGAVFCLGPVGVFALVPLCAALLWFLIRIIRTRSQGYTGDFFGFSIVGGELAALLAAVLTLS